MSDFVFAVWSDDPGVVLDPALHRRFGADAVQTNVAGDPRFSDALALQAMPEPIDAVVTVGADDPAQVEAALRGVARRVVGWEVQRRTPIRPPDTADGAPADAMANVAFLRRPPTWPTRNGSRGGSAATRRSRSRPRARSATCRTSSSGR